MSGSKNPTGRALKGGNVNEAIRKEIEAVVERHRAMGGRFTKDYWLNIYPETGGDTTQIIIAHDSRRGADNEAESYLYKHTPAMIPRPRLACVKITVDCAIGDGLIGDELDASQKP